MTILATRGFSVRRLAVRVDMVALRVEHSWGGFILAEICSPLQSIIPRNARWTWFAVVAARVTSLAPRVQFWHEETRGPRGASLAARDMSECRQTHFLMYYIRESRRETKSSSLYLHYCSRSTFSLLFTPPSFFIYS